jgi:hypothetical protein
MRFIKRSAACFPSIGVENGVLRGVFTVQRVEVTGEWGNCITSYFISDNVYSSSKMTADVITR